MAYLQNRYIYRVTIGYGPDAKAEARRVATLREAITIVRAAMRLERHKPSVRITPVPIKHHPCREGNEKNGLCCECLRPMVRPLNRVVNTFTNMIARMHEGAHDKARSRAVRRAWYLLFRSS